MTRVRKVFTATILVLALSAVPLSAQYVEMYRLDNRVKELPEQDVLNTLSTHLGVPVETLKQEKAQYKSSVGELYAAHQFAKWARSDVKTVMAERTSGKSWGVLAKEKKVDMDQFGKDARQLEEALKKTPRASR
jgi:hypothetical protein